MSGLDRISMALLKDVGVDPSIVKSVEYQHTAGDIPVMRVWLYVRRPKGDFELDECVEFEWRLKGPTTTIKRGTPEWDEWLASLPRAEDQP